MKTFNMTANKYFRESFLDFFNNYATVEKYAEHNGISTADAKMLIDAGRKYHEQNIDICRIGKARKETEQEMKHMTKEESIAYDEGYWSEYTRDAQDNIIPCRSSSGWLEFTDEIDKERARLSSVETGAQKLERE